MVDELLASPYLTRFPASLDLSPFPTTVHFREPSAPTGDPLPDWWDGSNAPLVYVTFGTVLGHMTLAADVYRTALAAVPRLDVRVLLTVGRQFERAGLGPLPANVHVEAWVDQARVFAEADLVVCHGGSGTVLDVVAAGVPLVVVPVFADQFENGHRVARTGAGLVVESEQHPEGGSRVVITESDAPRIAQGISEVLATASYRERSRVIGAEMAATPTVDEVLATLLNG